MGERLVRVAAGRTSDGRASWESLLADRQADGSFVLLRSRCLALDLARADRFVSDPVSGSYEVIERSGRLTVQMYFPEQITDDELEQLTSITARLEGGLDAHTANVAAMWVPVEVGFPRVEAALTETVAAMGRAQWIFGNVYGDDGQPLNW